MTTERTFDGKPYDGNARGRSGRAVQLLLVAALAVTQQTWASLAYYSSGEGIVDKWTDLSRWYTSTAFKTPATTYQARQDVRLLRPGTLLVDEDVYPNEGRYYSVELETSDERPVVLRIGEGGILRSDNGGVSLGKFSNPLGGPSVLDVRPGGTNAVVGKLIVGNEGPGIMTNAGTVAFNSLNIDIGLNTGATGLYVHDNGQHSFRYAPTRLRVGVEGSGELQVRSGDYSWTWYSSGGSRSGYVFVGSGTTGAGTGRITVEDGATMQTGPLALGGKDDTAGRGVVRLRGGSVLNKATFASNGNSEQLWIGAATNAAGAVRADSHGQIVGWGRVYSGGIQARLGNGDITADGEGVERTLDCSDWAAVSNVLVSAEVTNGWNAVNKGAVLLPVVNAALDTNGGDDWSCYAGTNSVGCARQLKVPNLLNAVHITAHRNWQSAGWNFGALYLAGDRSDAHAEALPANCRPLGFWKAGTFGSRTDLTDVRPFKWAEIRFRYDARKMQKPDSRVVVLRWNEATGSWQRLRRYPARPENDVASSGDLTAVSGDPDWTLGLFCVAEVERKGLIYYVR